MDTPVACTAGSFCPGTGLYDATDGSTPSECEAGIVCDADSCAATTVTNGAYTCQWTDTPFDGTYSQGPTLIQIQPSPCLVGTMNSPTDAKLSTQCIDCTAGYFCDTPGQIAASGQCDDGFICGTGNDRAGPYVTVHDPLVSDSSG